MVRTLMSIVFALLAGAAVGSPVPLGLLAASLDADAGAAFCGPGVAICEAGALAFTAVSALLEAGEVFGGDHAEGGNYCEWETCDAATMKEQLGPGPEPAPEEPECQANQDNDVNMQPDPSADNSGPCSVTCKDCHFTFSTTSQSSTTQVQFTNGININSWRLVGGMVLKCDGGGQGKYKLTLADEKNKFGMANAQQCERIKVNYQEEVDFDVEIEAEYSVKASGYIEADFELNAWESSNGRSGNFNITGVSGFFNGEFDAAASVSATVKDLLLINDEIVAGLGLTSLGSMELSGAAIQVDEDPSLSGTSLGPFETTFQEEDFTECMQAPDVTGTAELDFLVIGPGGDTAYTKTLLTGTFGSPIVPFGTSPTICAWYDEE